MMNTASTPTELLYYQWTMLQPQLECLSTQQSPAMGTPGTQASRHSAIWVKQGSVSLRIRTKHQEAQAGEWIFSPPNPHSTLQHSPDAQYLKIDFSMEWSGAGQLLHLPRKVLWKTTSTPGLESAALSLHQEFKRFSEETTDTRLDMISCFRIRHLFDQWLIQWEGALNHKGIHWKTVDQTHAKLVAATQYMENLPLHQPISVSEIANNLSMSPVHFTSLFRKEYGMPPKAYRQHVKLRQAIRDLQSSHDEIKVIASRFGFSPTWFGIWVKQQTGKTPMQIRREHQKQQPLTKHIKNTPLSV